MEDDNEKFFVSDPTKGKHVSYTVKGSDSFGDFEGSRRYKDFLALRNSLISKWPGCFIPPIPPKKAIGNKDAKFVEERRLLLQRFLREVGKNENLLSSEEFKTFARPQGPDIEKQINSLPKITSDQLIERLRDQLGVGDTKPLEQVKEAQDRINDFKTFGKKQLVSLNQVSDSLNNMNVVKANQIQGYKQFYDCIEKYEESCLNHFVDNNANKLIVGDFANTTLKDKINEVVEQQQNSYEVLSTWIKGEVLDLKAMLEAIDKRDEVESMKNKLENKKKSDSASLDKLSAGKSTMKTMFKGASGKQNEITTL